MSAVWLKAVYPTDRKAVLTVGKQRRWGLSAKSAARPKSGRLSGAEVASLGNWTQTPPFALCLCAWDRCQRILSLLLRQASVPETFYKNSHNLWRAAKQTRRIRLVPGNSEVGLELK